MVTKKIVAILGVVGGISFIWAGLYTYLFKGAPLQLLILTILFFGAGMVVSIISLTSKREKWMIDEKKLNKSQAIVLSICYLILGTSAFWVALVFNLHIIFRIVLLLGSVFLIAGSIFLLGKVYHQTSR